MTDTADRQATLRATVARNPADVEALMELGALLSADDCDRDAADTYRRVLAINPVHGAALCRLGIILHAYPAFRREAIALLEQALAIDARLTDAYRPLAWSLAQIGRREVAVAVLRVWCVAAPHDPVAPHLLAAYSDENVPDRASDELVRKIFDDGADAFDVLLRNRMHYRAPEVLHAHLASMLTPNTGADLDLLDMGCGTGLAAPLLRPWARHLVGVDLSPGMLDKARERGGYDRLETAELTSFLGKNDARFDVLFASDTLIYFGRVDDVFANAFKALRPGGWIACTVEKLIPRAAPPLEAVAPVEHVDADTASAQSADPDEPAEARAAVEQGDTPEPATAVARDFLLDTTGRYQHAEAYVTGALRAVGFPEPNIIEAEIRVEAGVPIVGLIIVAMKPVAHESTEK